MPVKKPKGGYEDGNSCAETHDRGSSEKCARWMISASEMAEWEPPLVMQRILVSWRTGYQTMRRYSLLRDDSKLARLLHEQQRGKGTFQARPCAGEETQLPVFELKDFNLDNEDDELDLWTKATLDWLRRRKRRRANKLIWKARDMEQPAWLPSSDFGGRKGMLSLHGRVLATSEYLRKARPDPLEAIEFRHIQGSLNTKDIHELDNDDGEAGGNQHFVLRRVVL
ncbi:hypothetical protein DL771_002269 [Monosporascus sp. 5C6A]|nr:hypothetical protein DL771_002269 [Monosporascus sp. 5C6A]